MASLPFSPFSSPHAFTELPRRSPSPPASRTRRLLRASAPAADRCRLLDAASLGSSKRHRTTSHCNLFSPLASNSGRSRHASTAKPPPRHFALQASTAIDSSSIHYRAASITTKAIAPFRLPSPPASSSPRVVSSPRVRSHRRGSAILRSPVVADSSPSASRELHRHFAGASPTATPYLS